MITEMQMQILTQAVRDGVFVDVDSGTRRISATLNGKGLFERDRKDGNRWYPTDKGRALADTSVPEVSAQAGNPGADYRYISLDRIDMGQRLRPIDQQKVDSLKGSFADIGLQTPPTVTPLAGTDRFLLRAGAHRLEALRQMGEEGSIFRISSADDLNAELWEIDENLQRAELTAADKALFTFRRKEIYLLKHPETAQHVAGGKARQNTASDTLSFAEATAQATGQTVRTVQRNVSRGEKISEKALRQLAGTRHDTGKMLDRLKNMPEPQQVVFVEATIAEDRRKKAEFKEIRGFDQRVGHAVRTDLAVQIAARQDATPWWRASGYDGGRSFPVIYADPPWRRKTYSELTGNAKAAENHYPTMALEEVLALGCPASDASALFLWVTDLAQGIRTLETWGFAYKSYWGWKKIYPGQSHGTGYWSFDNLELLLIGTRGDFPAPIPGTQPIKCTEHAVGGHSVKPVWFAEQLDRLYPTMPKLEMFQRRDSLAPDDIRLSGNWTFWGNQAGVAESEVA